MLHLRTRLFLFAGFVQVFLVPPSDGTLGLFKEGLDTLMDMNLLRKKFTECRPTGLLCRCGSTRNSVTVAIPQCKVVHLFKARCRPCDQMTADNICPIFQYCSECSSDGSERCLKCPRNRYGDWCEKICRCQNGGQCDRNDGRCICPSGYTGENCEAKRGCRRPVAVRPPLQAEPQPADAPTTIVYSCPMGYELSGAPVSTCLPDGYWSNPPPRCLMKCPLLSAPANGNLKYNGSELVEGVVAEVSCHENYQLSGESILRCLSTGKWSDERPRCVEMAFCTDPGAVAYAKRTIAPGTPKSGPYFLQGARIRYTCDSGFEQMGEEELLCLFDGTWSRNPPSCVKASSVGLDCKTEGFDVLAEVGVPVRVFCPPECADNTANIWGTSIYRIRSAICPAAVHSGKITNSGGIVAVINNGGYTSFAGSFINNIRSQNYEGRDESFRFDILSSASGEGYEGNCPRGLIRLGESCIHISSSPLSEAEAEAVCLNLGYRLDFPSSKAEQAELIVLSTTKGINELWIGKAQTEDRFYGRRSVESTNETDNSYANEPSCRSVYIENMQFVEEPKDCQLYLHFICIHSPTSRLLASCYDPGPLDNGNAKHVGKVDDVFYVGSSVEYSCESLHYLKGEEKSSCTAKGTWSSEKPTCVRVDTCSEPLVPIGGYVNYLPPLETPKAQRTAIRNPGRQGLRMGRLPMGLEAKPPQQILPTAATTPGPEANIVLPPGFHKVGTRAMYDCESRYYRLVGSRTRRCQGKDQWSGRPPTCMPVCGRSDSPRAPFIVNGNATDIGQWPWQAGLARYIQDYNQWFLLCGGSLLSERWVVTAAHCVTYAGTTLPIDPDKFRVYLGKYHRSDTKDDEYVQIKKVEELHIHPDYDPGIFDADIALLQLDTPVQLNSRVQPVCLPSEQTSRENIKPGTRGVVTGWGMNENETYSDTLQQAVLPVVSNEECEKGYEDSELPLSVTGNMFCAGFKAGKMDACSGDSGGPMVFADEASKERKWTLEGIVSWGSPKGCGNENQYGGFTEVSKFLNWIHLFF